MSETPDRQLSAKATTKTQPRQPPRRRQGNRQDAESAKTAENKDSRVRERNSVLVRQTVSRWCDEFVSHLVRAQAC